MKKLQFYPRALLVFVVCVAFGVIIGVSIYVTGKANGPMAAILAISTILALLMPIFMLQSLRTQRILDLQMHRFSSQAEIFKADIFMKDRKLVEILTSIAESYTSIHALGEDFLSKRAENVIGEASRVLNEMSSGKVNVLPHDYHEVASLLLHTTKAQDKVLATSYVETGEWWKNPSGEAYLQENINAVRRGAEVTRIFIFDNEKSFHQSEALMIKQVEGGMKIKVAYAQDVPTRAQLDCMLVDDRYAVELLLAADKKTVLGFTVEHSESAVSRLKGLFTELLSKSEPFAG